MSEEMAGDAAEVAAAFTFDTTERQIMALVVGHPRRDPELVPVVVAAAGHRESGGGAPGGRSPPRRCGGWSAWGYSPTLASFLTPIPVIGPLLATLGALWAFVTGVMAVRTAFGVGIWKAIGIEIAAFLVGACRGHRSSC